MQYKAFQVYELKELSSEREKAGLAAIFGNIDHGRDRIIARAFSKTIKERFPTGAIKHLWQHSMDEPPIAVVTDLKELKREDLPQVVKDQHPEVTGGLLVKRQYLDTTRGNEVLAGLNSTPAAITEMSFAYDAVKFDYEEDATDGRLVRNLKEIRLWETSDVNWGMNSLTVANVDSVKACAFVDTPIKACEAFVEPTLADFTDQKWYELTLEEKERIAAHFAIDASGKLYAFEDLLFPHHEASKEGIGAALTAALTAASDELLAAKHDLSMAQLESAFEHIKEHSARADLDLPKIELVRLAYTVKAALALVETEAKALILELPFLKVADPVRPVTKEAKGSNQRAALALKLQLAERQLAL